MVKIDTSFSVSNGRLLPDNYGDSRKSKPGVKVITNGFLKFLLTIFCKGMTIEARDAQGKTQKWFVNKNSYKNWQPRFGEEIFSKHVTSLLTKVLIEKRTAHQTRDEYVKFIQDNPIENSVDYKFGKDFVAKVDNNKRQARVNTSYDAYLLLTTKDPFRDDTNPVVQPTSAPTAVPAPSRPVVPVPRPAPTPSALKSPAREVKKESTPPTDALYWHTVLKSFIPWNTPWHQVQLYRPSLASHLAFAKVPENLRDGILTQVLNRITDEKRWEEEQKKRELGITS